MKDELKGNSGKVTNQNKSLINIASGQGVGNNSITQSVLNYNTFIEGLTAFKPVLVPYSSTIIVNRKNKELTQAEAIVHAKKLGKTSLPWFIAGKFSEDKRIGKNLISRSAIVLDLDTYEYSLKELETTVKSELSKYKYVAYSTASHAPEKPKIRIVLFLNKDIAESKYKAAAEAFASTLSFRSAIDEASFKPNQFMFISGVVEITDLPDGVTVEKYQPWKLENKGELLNPLEFKQKPVERTKPTQKVKLSLVTNNPETAANNNVAEFVEPEANKQKSLNLSEAEIAASLEKYPASCLSYDEWVEVSMALHHYYNGSDNGLAVFDEWSKLDEDRYSEEAIASKWRSFKKQGEKTITFYTVLMRIKEKRLEIFKRGILENIAKLTEEVRDDELFPILKTMAENCSEQEAEYYIRKIKEQTQLNIGKLRPIFNRERRKIKVEEIQNKGIQIYQLNEVLPPALFGEFINASCPKGTIENFKTLIDSYNIKIVRNVISKRDTIILPNDVYVNETADAARLVRIESLLDANNINKAHNSAHFCSEAAALNTYNPISEWVQSKVWDGIDRLQLMYDTVQTADHFLKVDKEHLLRKWLISVMAAMEERDGVFSKGVLIFQGKQSIGKTAWFKKLLPDPVSEYFLEGATLDPTNKDSKATVTSHAIVELGEADSTMKKDIAAIKAFLSSKKDTFRPVYGRVDCVLPRRTIFCASVNENEFLVDHTGNTRFWTIPITTLEYEHTIDMQQVWAQVLELYKHGERWYLNQEGERMLQSYNDQHVKTCPFKEMIVERYIFPKKDDPDTENKNEWLGATNIFLNMHDKLNGIPRSSVVASILNELGAVRSKHNKKFLVRENPEYKRPDLF
jgi:hypothetical protein